MSFYHIKMPRRDNYRVTNQITLMLQNEHGEIWRIWMLDFWLAKWRIFKPQEQILDADINQTWCPGKSMHVMDETVPGALCTPVK